MAVLLLPIFILIHFGNRGQNTRLNPPLSVMAVGLALAGADFVYFHALADLHALIAVIETIRRCNAVIACIAGCLLFHEKNLRKKSVVVLLMLTGIALLFSSCNTFPH